MKYRADGMSGEIRLLRKVHSTWDFGSIGAIRPRFWVRHVSGVIKSNEGAQRLILRGSD